jgi:type II secretory pathway pseudopilin PulG
MLKLFRKEEGFTIVEMVVTALVLSLGAAAVFTMLSSATKNTQRAKSTQVALDLAQHELEKLRGIPNSQLALTRPPSHVAYALNPSFRVSGSTFALIRQPPSEYQQLVVNGDSLQVGGKIETGVVDPGPEPFTSGDVTGEIYRYIVWKDDPASTTRWQDYKQVVIAVKLDTAANQSGIRGYVEVQSDFTDPKDSGAKDPIPGAEEEITGQQFYLSDTPCAASGKTIRKEITADHRLHNTLGVCGNGLQNGGNLGAPDALLLSSPPDPSPTDPSDPPLYDYSNDFYLEWPSPDTDKGVQIRTDQSSGCNYTPTATEHPEARVHRWVTDPMEEDFTLSGEATLEFYSRTLNDDLYTGTVCVFLFRRHEPSSSTATDTMLANKNGGTLYWTYTPKEETWNGFWPRNSWATLRLGMTINNAPITIPKGDRLGLALSVERGNTAPAEAIPIMYDNPLYPTRIEVETPTPIEGG